MIQKLIQIPEVIIPASTITLTLSDFTVFIDKGEVIGIRATMLGGAEPQHIEMRIGDNRLTVKMKTDLETAMDAIVAVDTNEQVKVEQQAREQVKADALKKEFDRAAAAGEIDAMGMPIK